MSSKDTTNINPIMDHSISEAELAKKWGKSRKSLANWRKSGKMPMHFKRGAEYRYLVIEIQKHERSK
jgi:hypothetical protein